LIDYEDHKLTFNCYLTYMKIHRLIPNWKLSNRLFHKYFLLQLLN